MRKVITANIVGVKKLSASLKEKETLQVNINNIKYISDGGKVFSVNGQTGDVIITAESLGALTQVDMPAYGHGLKLTKNPSGLLLTVDTANEVQKDNTLPITAAAVYTEVGNINVLLSLI